MLWFVNHLHSSIFKSWHDGRAILFMGIIVSTSLEFFSHATLIWVGLVFLFSHAMTYAMKTHSSLLLCFALALYPRGFFVLTCTTELHFDHLCLLDFSWLHLDSCLSQFLTMTFAKSNFHPLDFCNLTHPNPWKEHNLECVWLVFASLHWA